MITKIKIDDSEARTVAVAIQAATKRMAPAVRANAVGIAQLAEAAILDQIGEIPGIGHFLLPRTKISTTINGDVIVLAISGMSEGEAGFPPVSGGKPTAEMNLWAWHEYGPSNDGGDLASYQKDVGGITVQASRRSATAPSPYRGIVGKTVRSLTVQLNAAIQGIAGLSAYNTAASSIQTATKGKVTIAAGARSTLKAAGITPSFLAGMGATKVGVTKTGRIYVLGRSASGGSTFLPQTQFGIPTTIRTR